MASKLFCSVAKTYVKVAILLGVGQSLTILLNIGIIMAFLHCYRAALISNSHYIELVGQRIQMLDLFIRIPELLVIK